MQIKCILKERESFVNVFNTSWLDVWHGSSFWHAIRLQYGDFLRNLPSILPQLTNKDTAQELQY